MQKANNDEKDSTQSLASAYASLSDLIEKTGVDVDALGISQKGINSALKNGEIAAKSAAGSYNQLYAQYNLIKTALNAMSAEMRNSTNVGKVWEQQAFDIMEQLKAMQEATGKHTLSVGNYEKALNGLNISTQQVLREMPTLANSFSQFIIAISNNVPIFIDNFKRATKELGSMQKAFSAVLKSIFSWQTALLVLLTILPRFIKAMKDKKKAQDEDYESMIKEINAINLMTKALIAIGQAEVNAAAETMTLTDIVNDNTRSLEDRIAAGERLKEINEEELSAFTAEEIAAGNANTALVNLTATLKEYARAKAIIGKITEYSEKLIELELKNTPEKVEEMGGVNIEKTIKGIKNDLLKNVKTVSDFYTSVQTYLEEGNVTLAQLKGGAVGILPKQLWTLYDSFAAMVEPMDETKSVIAKLTDMLDPTYLLGGEDGDGGKSIKEELLKIPDYYYEMLEASFGVLEDGLQKELALFDLNYAKEADARQKALDEMRGMLATANASERAELEMQMIYLRSIMNDEEQAYYKEREKLIQDHITAYGEIVEEEDTFDEDMRKSINIRLKNAMAGRNAIIYDSYEKEQISKAELDRQLRDSEKKYWTDYLAELRENGVITIDIYNDIMAKLAKADDKASKKRKKGNRFKNIVEAGFAYSGIFGEKDTETGGRKVKDEYLDFADAINKALQTSMDYMDEWMDKRIEMAEIAIEKAKEEADIAKQELDYQQEARANGYANNVELTRKEYEERLAIEQKAIKEKERLEKAQETLNTATQISSLLTATAEIWRAYAGIFPIGPALALAATTAMWTAFGAAKIKAAQVTRASDTTYGEGMVEYLDYGGSHASGNDIDFGVDGKGRRRRVERGEMIGVINKRNVSKYGVNTISGIFNSLNKGTYDSGVVDSVNNAMLADMYGMSFAQGSTTDLSLLEQGVKRLVEQGETKVVAIPNGRIEYHGNSKRIIYNA